MTDKIRVAVLAGGKSAEHEISLISAENVIAAIDRERFDPVLITINRENRWFEDKTPLQIVPGAGRDAIVRADQTSLEIDVVLPILHGPFGEDGCIQGLLRCAALPFVGAGVAGSAVGMDKVLMKRLLSEAGLPIGEYQVVDTTRDELLSYKELAATCGPVLFIKPANMGSSVGIHRVSDNTALQTALSDAMQYDSKIVVEKEIVGREIECAVLDGQPISASIPGEIRPTHDFYSYEAKYTDKNGAELLVPAPLDEHMVARIQQLAIDTFCALECAGLARVDLFLCDDDTVYVNEINTIPGFTEISMYPKLWQASGITYQQLIQRLIELALQN